MNKAEIASVLYEVGTILDLLDDNPFKVRAHQNAARAIETLSEDLHQLAQTGKLTSIKGVGKQIAEKIEILINTNALPELDELKSKVPDGVFEMLRISGLGVKKVKALWRKLGVISIGELEYACNENRLMELDGFGVKSQERILKGIKTLRKFAGKRLLPDALAVADSILDHLKKEKSITRLDIVGSVRRRNEVVKHIDIVSASARPEKVISHFVKAPGAAEVISRGETKSTIRLESGAQVNIRVVSQDQFPYALHYFTGSTEHNKAMSRRAKTMGLEMNEYGLFKNGESVVCEDETEIFEALGLQFIPAERRENIGEIDEAQNKSAKALIETDDITGVIHCHTDYSDGLETIETMVSACIARGYKYLGVSDHSRSAGYAGGLTIDDLKRQSDHIDKVNEKTPGFHIFKGVESDILIDGKLDYPDEVFEKLDFVIASVHSGFNLDETKMTERIINAVKNRYTTMLGHPTGRLLLARDAYSVNMSCVIEACAGAGVIIELNANPHRLDIDWRHIGEALKAGVKISVNADAHRIPGLDHIKYGVMIARKGGCAKEDVFNTQNVDEISEYFKKEND
ncbi:DNA polymerase X family [hydrothermal vent metagenome]|uniref:DNA polymerase beta n=1 Tax=hydrothermal vent metagenome TaxID=652676 RepID=A0A3B1BAD2_9ZZZZ